MAKRTPMMKEPTFAEVRAKFQDQLFDGGEGAVCPCCNRYGKLYWRKLNSGMARALIQLHRHGGDNWVNVTRLGRAKQQQLHHLEYTKLRFWKLIEKHPTMKGSVWKLTQLGLDFLLRGKVLRRHVAIYDNRVFAFSSEVTTVRKALGSHFDYDELMRADPEKI
jgi:hypothetical protein